LLTAFHALEDRLLEKTFLLHEEVAASVSKLGLTAQNMVREVDQCVFEVNQNLLKFIVQGLHWSSHLRFQIEAES
jgi:hypothetical protein